MKTVVFIRERRSEGQFFTDYFLVEDHITDPESAIRAAVETYLKTPEGKEAVIEACRDYNWGDVFNTVPEQILNQHGIHFTEEGYTICVDQDEVLFPELQEEIEE